MVLALAGVLVGVAEVVAEMGVTAVLAVAEEVEEEECAWILRLWQSTAEG
jgi:hypothetical protein